MPTHNIFKSSFRIDLSFKRPIVLVLTSAIVAVSSITLLGWATHRVILSSWLGYAIPTAINSALLFISFSLLLFADSRWPGRASTRALMTFIPFAVILQTSRILFWSVAFDKIANLFFEQHQRTYPDFLFGKMSPLSAFGFLLVSLYCLICAVRRWNYFTRPLADALAVLLLILGTFPMIGYLHGTPLLYGGLFAPVALPSAILFILLSALLMAHNSARSKIYSLFIGTSTQARLIRAFLPALTFMMLADSFLDSQMVPWMARANPAFVDSLDTMLVLSASTLLILFIAPKVGRDLDATHEALLQSQSIAAAAFESSNGILISNADCVILKVNNSFSKITGYTAEEASGKKVNLLKSGRHDQAFYEEMWRSILTQGVWSGEIWNRRKNGEVYPEWLSITTIKNATGEVALYLATFTDMTQRKEAEDEIRNLAFYDPLTKLPNRRLLLDRLHQAMANGLRSHRKGALLFLDLDNFKALNDTMGHSLGDQLLQEVARRLQTCVREADTVARIGGDEFVVMLEGLCEDDKTAAAEVKKIGETILDCLAQSYCLSGHEHRTTVSIGAALFGDTQNDLDGLMRRADIAMYKAKSEGRNALRFFDQVLEAAVIYRTCLEKDLRLGIAEGQFILYYQPQVDNNGRLLGAEALVRWEHQISGIVYPGDFISIAEETGMILSLGHWVLENACLQLSAWGKAYQTSHLTLAVNISARQFQQPNFVDEVMSVLARTNANPKNLKLELTESLLLHDVDSVIAKMNALNAKGILFSLDDFGTGYSSLSYLQLLPLSQLKIDKSFVRNLHEDHNCAAIAQTIIALSNGLGLAVIAEGVETGNQLELLKMYGCKSFQGYLFGRPMPVEELELKYLSNPT